MHYIAVDLLVLHRAIEGTSCTAKFDSEAVAMQHEARNKPEDNGRAVCDAWSTTNFKTSRNAEIGIDAAWSAPSMESMAAMKSSNVSATFSREYEKTASRM
jgi:hypothetical protein